MPIIGHLDGLEGCYLVGWAASPEPRACKVTVRNAAGDVVAEGRANRNRADLAVLGLGRTSLAFRLKLPHIDHAAVLRVFGDEVELNNSPIEVGPGRFDGELRVHRGQATGWVTERLVGFQPPLVQILDQDGAVVGEGMARIDDRLEDPLHRPARFHIDLDQGCFERGELMLRAVAAGQVFGVATCRLTLKGHAERVSDEGCLGWLYSPEAPHRRFRIEVFRNGVSAGFTQCQLQRLDVKQVHPDSQNPGFAMTFKEPRAGELAFTAVSFRFPGSGRELFHGPFLVGSRSAAVRAARRVARLAHEAALDAAEAAVLQEAMRDFLARARANDQFTSVRHLASAPARGPRLSVIIPIYRDVAVTRDCIDSVLAHRVAATDRVVLINDDSPEPEMAWMLGQYAEAANLLVLANEQNLGFVRTINRGLALCDTGDVLLLNSDTRVFPGGIEEMWRVAQSAPDIGSVTALSNNATIFSYPHVDLRSERLDDIPWDELAAVALRENRGIALDVPTGHGFCLLIKREVLDRVGHFDEGFGRGYGEENDFCARAADLGYRNVVAAGVLVEHKESVSFTEDKAELLALNLPRLEARYPEYSPTIMESERQDVTRRGRWALDAARLRRAGAGGAKFAVVVQNGLGGGTNQAILDIERSAGYHGALRLSVCCRQDGFVAVTAEEPTIRALFSPDEMAELFALLAAAPTALLLVHQVLGYTPEFARLLQEQARRCRSICYLHDYYALCQRVTMVDATSEFCGAAGAEVCARCVRLAGTHEWSRFGALAPDRHRALFAGLLAAFTEVVTPSRAAAEYLGRGFPDVAIRALPHPEPSTGFPASARTGCDEEIVLVGAIGPHKGSGKLREIAQLALMTHPALRFRVIGYTDVDDALTALGNVTITGPYQPGELSRLLEQSEGRIALFLSVWPETYSYTLSEVARHGFVPVVPDIGAMAERVREAGFGVVMPFPIEAAATLRCLEGIGAGSVAPWRKGARPSALAPSMRVHEAARVLLEGEKPRPDGRHAVPAKRGARRKIQTSPA